MKIAYAPVYKYALPKGHRFPMEKYHLLCEQLLYEGTIDSNQLFSPKPLREEILLWTHTPTYWNQLKQGNLSRKEIRNIGFPFSPQLVQRGLRISQGTIDCATYALNDGIALNIAGGTHHAFSDHGEGFCLLNDIAIAANYLLRSKQVNQILIVDLDVHQGNGTAQIFQNRPEVFTFSMHGQNNYPLRKAKSDLDIGLRDGTEDALYLKILASTLDQLINTIYPNIIFYLSGVDVLETDKLGRLNLSRYGCKVRDQAVLESAKKYEIPIAVSMGGGYSSQLSDIIEAHANTYRVARSIYT